MVPPVFSWGRLRRAIKFRIRRWVMLPYHSEGFALPVILGLAIGFLLTLWIFL